MIKNPVTPVILSKKIAMNGYKIFNLFILLFFLSAQPARPFTQQFFDGVNLPVQITTSPDEEFNGTLSPDGSAIAFVSNRSGNNDLWLKYLDPGNIRGVARLTRHTAEDTSPSFSPDGRRIAFVSHRTDPKGDIYILNITEAESGKSNEDSLIRVTTIASSDHSPAWISDKEIVYSSIKRGEKEENIWKVNIISNEKEKLTFTGGINPSVSSDWKYISYTSNIKRGRGDIIVLRLKDMKTVRMTSGQEMDGFSSWSFNTRKIFFSRYANDTNMDNTITIDDNPDIWSVAFSPEIFDSQDAQPKKRRLTGGRYYDQFPEFNKGYIYYTSNVKGNIDIRKIPSAGIIPPSPIIENAVNRAENVCSFYTDDPFLCRLSYENVLQDHSDDADTSLLAKSRYTVAQLYYKARNLTRAEEEFKKAVNDYPEIALYKGLSEIGLVMLNIDNNLHAERSHFSSAADRAIQELQSIKKRFKNQKEVAASAQLKIGDIFALLKKNVNALTAYKAVIAAFPDQRSLNAEAEFSKNKLYLDFDEQEKLTHVFLQVIKGYPDIKEWSYRAAKEIIHLFEKEPELSKKILSLRELIKKYGRYPILPAMARNRIGELYYQDFENLKARQEFQRTVNDFPDDHDQKADALFFTAKIYFEDNEFKKSLEIYKNLEIYNREKRDVFLKARRNFIAYGLRKGERELREGEIRLAIKTFRMVIDYDYNATEAHRGMIRAYAAVKEIQKSIDYYTEKVRANKNDHISLYSLGLSLTYLDPPDIDKAIDLIRSAIMIYSQIPFYHQTMGWLMEQKEILLHKGKFMEAALEEYQTALALTPLEDGLSNRANLLLNIGNAYYYLKNFRMAYRFYKKREEIASLSGNRVTELLFFRRYGEAAFKNENTDESIRIYKKALNLVDADDREMRAMLMERLGLAYQVAGMYEEAVNLFSMALELNQQLTHSDVAYKNTALLLRNIGNNLFNLSVSDTGKIDRKRLRHSLDRYLNSLKAIEKFGVVGKRKSSALIAVETGLDEKSSAAARGFDEDGEKRLIFNFIGKIYEGFNDYQKGIEFFSKKLSLIPENLSVKDNVPILTEKAITVNQIGYFYYMLHQFDRSIEYFTASLQLCAELKNIYGLAVNSSNIAKIIIETAAMTEPTDPGNTQDITLRRIEKAIAIQTRALKTLEEKKSVYKNPKYSLILRNNLGILHLLLAEQMDESSPVSKERDALTHVMTSLAQLDNISRHFKKSLANFREGKKIIEATDSSSLPDRERYLSILNQNIAQARYAAGSDKKMRKHTSSDIAALKWKLLFLSAQLRPEKDIGILTEAAEILRNIPVNAFKDEDIAFDCWLAERLYKQLAYLLMEKGEYEEALKYSETGISSKYSLVIGQKEFMPQDEMDQEYYKAFKDAIRHSDKNPAGYKDMKDVIIEEREELASLLFPSAIDPVIIQEILNKTDIVINLSLLDNRLMIWRITNNNITGELVPVEPPLSENRLDELSSLFFSSASSDLQGKKRIYIITSDIALESLPWNAFLINDQPLINSYQLVFANNLEHLFFSYQKRNLFTSRKVSINNRSLTGALPLFSDDNIRESLLSDPPLFNILHIEGDVFLDAYNPERSFIDFSQGKNSYNRMEVWELLNTSFSPFLVSLSNVISSNGNKRYMTSPTLFLHKGLLYAGFPHILINTGSYDKEYNTAFISAFYTRLNRLSPSEALQSTQIEFREKLPSNTLWQGYRLYGYGGMTETERKEFAESNYMDNLTAGVDAFAGSKWKKSIMYLENAVALSEITKEYAHMQNIYKVLADAAFNLKDYPTAIKYEKRLTEILKKGDDPEQLADAIYFLGILYSRAEDYQNAAVNLNKAINIYKEYELLDKIARGYSTLGIVEENSSDYENAQKYFKQSLSINKEIGETAGAGMEMRRLGRIYYLRLNQYHKAKEYFNAALETFQQENNISQIIQSLLEIGLVYERMGDFKNSLEYYQEARQMAEQSDDSIGISQSHIYTANTYWFQGDYQQAFKNIKKGLKIAEEIKNRHQQILIYNLQGLIYWTLNDPDRALQNLTISLNLAKEADSTLDIASAYNNIGLVFRQNKEYEKSIEYFNKAMEMDKTLKTKWGIAYDHRNIGMSYIRMGKIDLAEPHIQKAVALSREIGNRINEVKALLELGNIAYKKDNINEAVNHYRETYNLSGSLNIPEVSWRALRGTALSLLRKGEREDALVKYKEAIKIVEKMRASIKIEEFKNSFLENKQDLYMETILLLLDMGRIKESFSYSERARARSFIDLLGNQRLTLKDSISRDLYEKQQSLAAAIRTTEEKLKSSDEKQGKKIKKELIRLRNSYKDLLIEIKLKNPQLSTFVSIDPSQLDEIFSLLKKETALLEYLVTKKEIIVWILLNTRLNVVRIPIDEAAIQTKVKKYRKLIQHLEPLDEQSKELYTLLLRPVEKYIKDAQYLGIVPHGILHYLSFASLKDKKGYLIEKYPLFYAPSASALKFTFKNTAAVNKKEINVLAIGNPDLGSMNYDLPLAEMEAKSIRWNFPKIDILTRKMATESWIKKNIGKYDIIHIASHGEFDDINPLFSSLKLTKGPEADGNLEVNEIFSLDLKADLVTLSACQTGLGSITKGDEIIGLNRAFFYAGTRSIISSLWRVSDISTAIVMKHFYRNYLTRNKAQSLRSAQLLVKRFYPHPAYWSGFSLTGEYR